MNETFPCSDSNLIAWYQWRNNIVKVNNQIIKNNYNKPPRFRFESCLNKLPLLPIEEPRITIIPFENGCN